MTDTFQRLTILAERMFEPAEDSDRDWRLLVLLAFVLGIAVG